MPGCCLSQLAASFRHQAVVVLGALCGCFTTATVLLCSSVNVLVAGQWSVSFSLASHAAIAALALRAVPPEGHAAASGAVKAATLGALGISALLGQALVTLKGTPIRTLFVISLAGQVLALMLALALPSEARARGGAGGDGAGWGGTGGAAWGWRKETRDQSSIDQGSARAGGVSGSVSGVSGGGGGRHCCCSARLCAWWDTLYGIARDLWCMLCEPTVALWTVWGVMCPAVHALVMTYWQSLVADRAEAEWRDADAKLRNGYALAATYAVTGVALLAGGCSRAGARLVRPASWPWQAVALVLSPLGMGSLLLGMSATSSTYAIYAELMGTELVFECAQVLASAAVASALIRRAEADGARELRDAEAAAALGFSPLRGGVRAPLLPPGASTTVGESSGSSAAAGIEAVGGGRLALLFTMTAAVAAAAQMGLLRAVRALAGEDHAVARWFAALGIVLLATAGLLVVVLAAGGIRALRRKTALAGGNF